MEAKIKNIFVLVLVFTAISTTTLWLITPDKGGKTRVIAGSGNTLLGSIKTSPPETDNQDTVMIQKSAETPEVAVGLGREEIESTAATEEVDQQARDAAAYLALGIESYKKEDLQKAISHFQEALRLEPGNSTAQQLIAKESLKRLIRRLEATLVFTLTIQ
ncbi:MAG: Tetratricopeptide repeat [Deltaproteobacteria bacterium]|nr:Tetratricopeptide repeat [Deltaproteobacteria bacterium]